MTWSVTLIRRYPSLTAVVGRKGHGRTGFQNTNRGARKFDVHDVGWYCRQALPLPVHSVIGGVVERQVFAGGPNISAHAADRQELCLRTCENLFPLTQQ